MRNCTVEFIYFIKKYYNSKMIKIQKTILFYSLFILYFNLSSLI